MHTWKGKADRKEKGGLHLKRLWVLPFVQLLLKMVLHSSHLLSKIAHLVLPPSPTQRLRVLSLKISWFVLNQLQLLFYKPELWSGPLLLGVKADQNCNNQVRRSLSLHVSQIILSLSHSLIEKRPNYQNKGPICRRIGKALCNLMKYLKCPCDIAIVDIAC